MDMQIQTSLVNVFTTSNRGATPEELAEQALDKILYVSETAPEPLRAQAIAFRDHLRGVLVQYLRTAARAERSTVVACLTAAGYVDAAALLRKE